MRGLPAFVFLSLITVIDVSAQSQTTQISGVVSDPNGSAIAHASIEFASNGNTIICVLHWTATQPTGNILDVRNVDVYTVDNGRIILAKIYSEDIDQENAFWGK